VPRDRTNRLSGLMDQVRAELTAAWTVERMAAASAMSPRTLLRRFTEATGQSPGDWLIAERLAEAQRLLEASSLPVESVAAEAGFGSVQALRHHFQARLGLAPRAYRSSFGAAR
jgi:AraC family transcriptional activator FtrA